MRLSDIIGQEVAVKTLEHSIKKGKISHAYLFDGENGVGKETTALSLVNHLLCESKSACGQCPDCLKFERGNHPGFRLIDSDSTSIKIDQIRDLKEKAQFINDHYMIWLIKDSHKMTLQAANCFLKLLEEPGRMTVFILVTNNLRQILPTIRSRCQVISFSRLSDESVHQILSSKVDIDSRPENTVNLIIKMSRGSIGKALELWDIPFLERRKWIIEQLINIPSMRGPEILGLSQKWIEDRSVVETDLELMLQWYRDLWCTKIDANEWIFNMDYQNELSGLSKKYPLASLEQITTLIMEMIVQLQRNVRVRFIMGYLLLQMRKGVLA